MVNSVKDTVSKPKHTKQSKKKCCHHWVLETPNGPTAMGVCKYCGKTQVFYNSWPNNWSENQQASQLKENSQEAQDE